MTYPGAYGTPTSFEVAQPRPRPATVTVAAISLFVIASLGLISALASFLEVGPAAARVTTGSDDADTVTIALVFYGLIALVAALYYVVAGIFVMRGNRGLRIATWVIAGLTVLCLGCNGLGNGVLASGLDSTTIDSSSSSSVLLDNQSHAYVVVTLTIEILSTLVAIVAIILLALPASNAFFRKVDPMAAMHGAYGYPGYGYAYPGQVVPGYPPSASGGYYDTSQPGADPAQAGYPQWQSVPAPGQPVQPTPVQPAPAVPEPQPQPLANPYPILGAPPPPAAPHLPETPTNPDDPSDSIV